MNLKGRELTAFGKNACKPTIFLIKHGGLGKATSCEEALGDLVKRMFETSTGSFQIERQALPVIIYRTEMKEANAGSEQEGCLPLSMTRLKTQITDVFLIFLLVFLPLVYQLKQSTIQPTTDLWVQRSVSFMVELGRGNLAGTYQQYHPGVTVMWPVALGSWVYYHYFAPTPQPNVLSAPYFLEYLPLAQVPLMFVLALLLTVSYVLLRLSLNRRLAFLTVTLLIFEPFFLANARTIHLDGMLTLTMFASALFLYLTLKRPSTISWTLTGMSFGFSWLSKVVTVYLLPFTVLVLFFARMTASDKLRKFFLLFFLGLVTFTAFFPVMWVSPIDTLVNRVLSEGIFETGVEEVSRGLLLGFNQGFWYHALAYPVTILFRLSPLLSIGLAALIVQLLFFRRSDPVDKRTVLYWAAYGFFYLVMISLSGKKIYRYVLPVFPVLAIFAAYGWSFLIEVIEEHVGKFRREYNFVLGLVLLAVLTWQFFFYFPNFFAYFNPFLGGIKGAATVVDLNQDATGYQEVARYLNRQNGAEGLTVASFDWKILGLLFPGETVSAKNEPKPLNADYLLLPVQRGHEWVTEEYELERTFSVRGFDYWYLYKKRS